MVHPSNNSLGDNDYQEFLAIVDQYKKNHDLFVRLTIERAGISRVDFERLYEPRRYLTPEEALRIGKNGLIDKIE